MFCKNCGAQNADQSKFCTSCGTLFETARVENTFVANPAPQFTAPQSEKPKKKGGAKIVIIIVSVLVLIIALAIGGFFAYKKFFDPSSKVLSALNSGDLDAALEHYDEVEEISDELEKGLKDRLNKVYSDFLADKIKYEEAKDEIAAIKKMNIRALSSAIKETGKKVDKLNDSRAAFKTAEAFMDESNYEKAITNFKDVIEDDPNYKKAKEKLSECIDKYREQVLTNAASYAGTGDYTTAIALLTDANNIIKNDTEITKQKALYEAELADKQLDDILAEAEGYAEDGDLPSAISTLDRALSILPDSAEIKAKYEEYCTEFENEIIADADELADDGDYDEAIYLLNSALLILPDSERLSDKKTEINDLKPISFMDVCAPYDRSYNYEEYIGNSFEMAGEDRTNGFTIMCYDNYAISNLGAKYSLLTFDIGTVERGYSVSEIEFSIYLDGVLYDSSTIFIDDLPQHFEIDVKGVKQIKFTFSDGRSNASTSSTVGLADMFLFK